MEFLTEGWSLAPMAGITDSPFRLLCRRLGATCTLTEMVSAAAICRESPATTALLEHSRDLEGPIGVQLFGARPSEMARAASVVSAPGMGFDFVDINAGCPVRKVTRKGAGAALLRDIGLLGRVVESVCSASRIPVTLKTRAGWSPSKPLPAAFLRDCASMGLSALTVHGRYASEGFAGPVRTGEIRRCAELADVPVVANGDSSSPRAVRRMLRESGVRGAMLGRGAASRPWLFRYLSGRVPPDAAFLPLPGELSALVREQLDLMVRLMSERRPGDPSAPYRLMRSKLVYYMHGFHGAAALRRECSSVSSAGEIMRICARAETAFATLRDQGNNDRDEGPTTHD